MMVATNIRVVIGNIHIQGRIIKVMVEKIIGMVATRSIGAAIEVYVPTI
jgi:hypothetical protein